MKKTIKQAVIDYTGASGEAFNIDAVFDAIVPGVVAVQATFFDGRTLQFLYRDGEELEEVEFTCWPPSEYGSGDQRYESDFPRAIDPRD